VPGEFSPKLYCSHSPSTFHRQIRHASHLLFSPPKRPGSIWNLVRQKLLLFLLQKDLLDYVEFHFSVAMQNLTTGQSQVSLLLLEGVMNRLWVQLTLAITFVVLVAVGIIAVLINRTTDIEFRQYITRSGMQASGSGIQQLVAYYEQEGSWQGVDDLLAEGISIIMPMGMPVMPPMDRRPNGPGPQLDILLADASGKVIYDSAGKDEGKHLSSRDRTKALPITREDSVEVIGYLLLSLPVARDRLGSLEQRFLDRMERILFIGTVLAVGLGLVIGLLLSRNLTAPLQRLASAARAVAGGDLEHQVKVEGSAEMAKVAQAFNEMTIALADSERQRQNMVVDVAHELRTPLSVVQGNLQAILDGVYALDKAEISRLYDETRLLNRLVNDLRELALADAGQLSLDLQRIDIAQVIESTVENLSLAAEAHEVTLIAQIPDDLCPVRVDPDRVAQILRNLLVNALRHTPSEGTVEVTASQTATEVQVAIADTGEGIAPENLAHIFDRFWRADRSRARDSQWAGGSGLGLSVAQSLVEAQGGRIWAESKLGKGSTFYFALPLWSDKPSSAG
jgi:two-component system OmpR family sensor kinase